MPKLDNDFRIRMSKTLIEAIGWDKGDEIRVKLDDRGNIILVNLRFEKNENCKTIFG